MGDCAMKKIFAPIVLAIVLAVSSLGCFTRDAKYIEYIKPLVTAYQLEITRMMDFENQPFKGLDKTVGFYEGHKNNLRQIQDKLTIAPKAKTAKWKEFHNEFDGLLSRAVASGDMTGGAMTSALNKMTSPNGSKPVTAKKSSKDKRAAAAYLSNKWETRAFDARGELIQANAKVIPYITTELKIVLPDIGENKLLSPLKKCFKP
jgi:hypothetical protein